ncbi:MAG: Cytochrome c-type biogenesis protein CcsA/ResC, partial [uncultured Pseudonocardia sp.]
ARRLERPPVHGRDRRVRPGDRAARRGDRGSALCEARPGGGGCPGRGAGGGAAARRALRAHGRVGDAAGRAAAPRVDRGAGAGRRALAAGQHVRVQLGDLRRRGGDLAGGAPAVDERRAHGGPVRAAPRGRADVHRPARALRRGRTRAAGAAVVLARRARHHDQRLLGPAARVRGGERAVPAAPRRPAGPPARGGRDGPAGLPRHDRRVPAVHLRRHHRRGVGRGGVGPVLGLGPQGDRGLRVLGGLRRLPARPRDRGLAHGAGGVDQHRGLRHRAVQPVLHQHGRGRAALLRRPGV